MQLRWWKKSADVVGKSDPRKTTLFSMSPETSEAISKSLRSIEMRDAVKQVTAGQVREINGKILEVESELKEKRETLAEARSSFREKKINLAKTICTIVGSASLMIGIPGGLTVTAVALDVHLNAIATQQLKEEKESINILTEEIHHGNKQIIKEANVAVGNKHHRTVYTMQQAHHLTVRTVKALENDSNNSGSPPLPANWQILNKPTNGKLAYAIDGAKINPEVLGMMGTGVVGVMAIIIDGMILYDAYDSGNGTGLQDAIRGYRGANSTNNRATQEVTPLVAKLEDYKERKAMLLDEDEDKPESKDTGKFERIKSLARKIKRS